MFRLNGKRALVTGAATGLGQAIAISLARQGAHVAISDKPGISLNDTLIKIAPFNSDVFPFAMDVRKREHITDGMRIVFAQFGKVDVLVNNAGINRPMPGLGVTQDNWDDHFDTNVKGGFFCAQEVAPGMMATGWGRIIFIASQSGLIGIPGQAVYCSTKGAVIQLARTLGVEWADKGITVNAIAPTFVETSMTRERLKDPEFLRFVLHKIPVGRLATPQDVAAAAVYLASDEANMVNASVLRLDGGWTAW